MMTLDFRPDVLEVDVGRGILYAAGSVQFRVGDRLIRANNLVAWYDLEKTKPPSVPPEERPSVGEGVRERLAEWPVKEVYADGLVLFTQGQETIVAERIYLDVVNDRGIVVDAAVNIQVDRQVGKSPLVVRADELRLLAQNRILGVGVKVTTCGFAHPHYHVASESLEIIRERPGYRNEPGEPTDKVENYHVEARGNVLHWGHTPVFWVPDFVGDTAARRPFLNIEDVRFNSSSEFGRQIGITVGDDIVDSEGRRWGHWRVHPDWLSKRGLGIGADLVYHTDDYRGDFVTRYQRDRGSDRFFGDPAHEDRYRFSWRHRHKLPYDIQLDLEYQKFSDQGFYPTYFEDEDKSEKPPENLAYLKKSFFNSQISGLFKFRHNDFLSQVEQKPELRYDLITEPIVDLFGSPLYLSTTLRLSNSRPRVAKQVGSSLPRTLRTDVDTLVEYAFPLGPFKITPFAGVRHTWWEKGRRNERDEQRLGFTHGATISFQAWNTWDAKGGLFDLDGLRHVVVPQITFRNTVGVDPRPASLIPIDDIEAFDNDQVVEFRVRTLLQTIRHRPDGPAVDQAVDLEVGIDFHPNPRDNGGQPWSNLDVDLVLRFSDDFQLATDFEASFYGGGFEVANIVAGYTPDPELQLYGGYRHFRKTYDAIFVQGNWRVSEKWLITAGTSYDLLDKRGLDHRVTLSRIGHDWVLGLDFRVDQGENDVFFGFSIEPRFLFNPVQPPRGLRSEPRLAYIGSGLRN